jgi:hypothetical protein
MAIRKVLTESDAGAYVDIGTIEPLKWNPILPAVNGVDIGFIPTLTGNTTNKNEFVVDPNKNNWFIDYGGDAVNLTPPDKPIFQALKTVIQSVSTSFSDLVTWDTPTIIDPTGFSFDATQGVITLTAAGVYEVSAHVLGHAVVNNRVELSLKLVDSSGDVVGALDRQYALRNGNQDEGSAQFSSFLYTATAGETLKLQVTRNGATSEIITAKFTIKKII